MWSLCRNITGPYDIFKKGSEKAVYDKIGEQTLSAERGIFQIVMDAGVYVSLIAVLISAILLIIFSNSKNRNYASAKSGVLKVLILSVFLFAVTGVIDLIWSMGLDY